MSNPTDTTLPEVSPTFNPPCFVCGQRIAPDPERGYGVTSAGKPYHWDCLQGEAVKAEEAKAKETQATQQTDEEKKAAKAQKAEEEKAAKKTAAEEKKEDSRQHH